MKNTHIFYIKGPETYGNHPCHSDTIFPILKNCVTQALTLGGQEITCYFEYQARTCAYHRPIALFYLTQARTFYLIYRHGPGCTIDISAQICCLTRTYAPHFPYASLSTSYSTKPDFVRVHNYH